MSSIGPVLIELAERPWSELDDGERRAFGSWLEEARGEDLYLLLREARSRWRRRRRSSSHTLAAQRELEAPLDDNGAD